MIVEVHRKVKNNVGDYYSNPSRYFNFDKISSQELMHNNTDIAGQNLIIGGGGLIHKKFSHHIQNLIDKKPKHTVLWGIGHNFGKKHIAKTQGDVYYPSWIENCSLVGIRDWIEGREKYYLPCVTCMHPAFDRKYKIEHENVYFTHAFKSKYQQRPNDIHMKNDVMNFDKVVKFLGSGDTVVTDSYHGVYWAQLLGRKVKTVSWSVKFNHLKYPPCFIEDIYDNRSQGLAAPCNFLQECRDLNTAFYQEFKKITA